MSGTTTTVTMASLLESLTPVFTTAMTNIVSIVNTVVGSPLLLLGAAMMFTLFIIRIFKSLLYAA